MVEGLFAGLILLFSNDQAAISQWLEGTWIVIEDNNTDNYRTHWHQVYTFENCDKQSRNAFDCHGYYGWTEKEEVTDNLLDKSFFSWSIGIRSPDGSRRIEINDVRYDFLLQRGKRTLTLLDTVSRQNLLVLIKK